MIRRHALFSVLALPGGVLAGALADPPRPLVFPADFGAHPDTRTEWWYLTGRLESPQGSWGFQVTFFRSATGIAAAEAHPSRFAARHLVFAHAALSDLQAGRLRHDQRMARAGFGIASAAEGDTAVVLRDWSLRREGPPDASRYLARVASDTAGFQLDLILSATQPVLLQGRAGLSRKGPDPAQHSHYYSQPQLMVRGTLTLDGRALGVGGRAWLDHEWSRSLLAPEAVGWDWIGMNLDDGSALTAFRLRRADGSALYAGGSFRSPTGRLQDFGPDTLHFVPGRRWRSPASQADYPVEWRIETPAGAFEVRALMDAQELDSRASTGAFYWEGLSELRAAGGTRSPIGRGYLEMTGYAARLVL
jgi:predicted secreted hydrolase